MDKQRKTGLIVLVVGALIVLTTYFWDKISAIGTLLFDGGNLIMTILMYLLAVVVPAIAVIVGFLIVSPLLKKQLLHNPDMDEENDENRKFSMFIEVGTARSAAIDFGGNYTYAIDGDLPNVVSKPKKNKEGEVIREGDPAASFPPWKLYKDYIWWALRVHVYLPYFMKPKSYDLRRYKVLPEGKKRIYVPVKPGENGYRSNHVRTGVFTWNIEFEGIEIQTVPFTIRGSAQVRIDKNKVKEALYMLQSWNLLLDQALYSEVRQVVRSTVVTVDMVIGMIEEKLWTEEKEAAKEGESEGVVDEGNGNGKARARLDMYEKVTDVVLEGVLNYQFFGERADEGGFAGYRLADFGIIVYRIDITDFEDELTEQEKIDMRTSMIGRQKGRARALEDQGIALGASALKKALESGDKQMSDKILAARSLVDASRAGNIDALIASFIKDRMSSTK